MRERESERARERERAREIAKREKALSKQASLTCVEGGRRWGRIPLPLRKLMNCLNPTTVRDQFSDVNAGGERGNLGGSGEGCLFWREEGENKTGKKTRKGG